MNTGGPGSLLRRTAMLPNTTIMLLKFHIRDIILAFYVANMLAYQYLWEEIKGTGVLGPFYL